MRMRTARRGRFAGQAFWGCSRYPKCKATLHIEDSVSTGGDPSVKDVQPNNRQTDESWTFHDPVRLPATPALTSTDALFLECGALPRVLVEQCASTDVPPDLLRAVTQWQLDMPQRPAEEICCPPWLAVAEKLLKRGRLTTLSPTLEAHLRRLADVPAQCELPVIDVLSEAAEIGRQVPDWESGFESLEEEYFAKRCLPSALGPDAAKWLLRQVHLLAAGNNQEVAREQARVDFTLCMPQGPHLVIEIDGVQHWQTRVADEERDEQLRSLGFGVVRIAAEEVRLGHGPGMLTLSQRVQRPYMPATGSAAAKFAYLCRRAHQLQLAVWHFVRFFALSQQALRQWNVAVEWDPEACQWDQREIVDRVLDDLNELFSDVAHLYGCKAPTFRSAEPGEADLVVDFTGNYRASSDCRFFVRDVFLPLTIAAELTAASEPVNARAPDRQVCERLLRRVYGFPSFREGQYEALARALAGKDAVVLLPTGAGKSAVFQLAGLLRPGVTLVIAPILSLIEDQLYNLRFYGIDRACQVTSLLDAQDRRRVIDVLSTGEYHLCYIAPERLQDEAFREALRTLTQHAGVSVAAIDEAHCVSEWGHDFRPAYLNIARIIREYCRWKDTAPPILALTGTASRSVLRDVQRELEILDYEAVITPSTFDRPELRFHIIPCRAHEKPATLRGILEQLPARFGLSSSIFYQPRPGRTCSGLVFCPWVNGEYGITTVQDEIARTLRIPTDIYSGRPPNGWEESVWRERRRHVALKFKRDCVPLLVCTKAFGMGIDKPNIRYTVHYALPPSVEAFYQEAGRAGRDGQPSHCYLIFSNDHPNRTRRLLDPSLPADELRALVDKIDREARDDVVNMLWFHTQAFSGIADDYQAICALLDEIGDIESARKVELPFTEDDRTVRERALHRLVCMGVARDYTVNHASRTFTLWVSGASKEDIIASIEAYVSNYQRGQGRAVRRRLEKNLDQDYMGFVHAAAQELVRFVYGVVERSRRQALAEMLAMCEASTSEDVFRQRLLEYLGTTEYSEHIKRLTEDSDGGLGNIMGLVELMTSRLDASQVRGEVGRALEAYPDHPGLRILRGLSEAMCDAPDRDTVIRNLLAGVRFARERYGVTEKGVLKYVFEAAVHCARQRPAMAQAIATALVRAFRGHRAVARAILRQFPTEGGSPALAVLLRHVKRRIDEVVGA